MSEYSHDSETGGGKAGRDARELWHPRQSASWKRAAGRGLAEGQFPPPAADDVTRPIRGRAAAVSFKKNPAAAASLPGMAESGVQVGAGAGEGASEGLDCKAHPPQGLFAAGAACVVLPAAEAAAAARLFGESQSGRSLGRGTRV